MTFFSLKIVQERSCHFFGYFGECCQLFLHLAEVPKKQYRIDVAFFCENNLKIRSDLAIVLAFMMPLTLGSRCDEPSRRKCTTFLYRRPFRFKILHHNQLAERNRPLQVSTHDTNRSLAKIKSSSSGSPRWASWLLIFIIIIYLYFMSKM